MRELNLPVTSDHELLANYLLLQTKRHWPDAGIVINYTAADGEPYSMFFDKGVPSVAQSFILYRSFDDYTQHVIKLAAGVDSTNDVKALIVSAPIDNTISIKFTEGANDMIDKVKQMPAWHTLIGQASV